VDGIYHISLTDFFNASLWGEWGFLAYTAAIVDGCIRRKSRAKRDFMDLCKLGHWPEARKARNERRGAALYTGIGRSHDR